MNVGVVVPDWGGSPVFGNGKNLTIAQDLNASGVSWVRWDAGNSIANLKTYWVNAFPSFRVCLNFAADSTGSYNSGGVQTVNATTWASWALNVWQTNGLTSARVPAIEILNEPYTAFWGSSPNTQANAVAYGALIKQAYSTFHAALGANSPLILAATYGGQDYANPTGTPSWWTWLRAAHPDIGSYYDGVVVHPYGGGSGAVTKAVSAAGCRDAVTTAATITGKPVWCTEYGWRSGKQSPNNVPDDGLGYQFTDAEVAANITGFNGWCRSTGYVGGTFFFEYLDEPSPYFWGVCYGNNPAGADYVHKPAPHAALVAAAAFTAPLSVGVTEA